MSVHTTTVKAELFVDDLISSLPLAVYINEIKSIAIFNPCVNKNRGDT